jgi:hypothetical protein
MTAIGADVPRSAEEQANMTGYDRKEADSYGKRLVGFTFNPSGDPKVAQLKGLFAEIIDICADDLGKMGEEGDTGPLYREAIMRTLDAQMWTVKAATWPKAK